MAWKPKTKPISFRVTEKDYKKLEKLADENGKKIARFMDEDVLQFYFEAQKILDKNVKKKA